MALLNYRGGEWRRKRIRAIPVVVVVTLTTTSVTRKMETPF
jgi:hypothetical protein